MTHAATQTSLCGTRFKTGAGGGIAHDALRAEGGQLWTA